MVKVIDISGSEHVEIMGRFHHFLEARAIGGYVYFEISRLQKRLDEEINDELRQRIGLRLAKWRLWWIEFLAAKV